MQDLIHSKTFILLGLERRILILKGLREYFTEFCGSDAFIRSLDNQFRLAQVEIKPHEYIVRAGRVIICTTCATCGGARRSLFARWRFVVSLVAKCDLGYPATRPRLA